MYVAAVLVALAAPQLVATGSQFVRGFRPMRRAPARVALSWDMFATRIERCAVAWDPPLHTPYGPIGRLRDVGRRLEWDVVQDTVDDYETLALDVCRWAAPGRRTHVTLRCVAPAGHEVVGDFDCP
jgi:hypothetical protein